MCSIEARHRRDARPARSGGTRAYPTYACHLGRVRRRRTYDQSDASRSAAGASTSSVKTASASTSLGGDST